MDCQGESLEVRRARERKFLAKVEDVKESAKNFQGKFKKTTPFHNILTTETKKSSFLIRVSQENSEVDSGVKIGIGWNGA